MYEAKVNNIVCVLHSLSIPDARLASVEVALTILKMENTQTHRGSYRVRPGLKIALALKFLIFTKKFKSVPYPIYMSQLIILSFFHLLSV